MTMRLALITSLALTAACKSTTDTLPPIEFGAAEGLEHYTPVGASPMVTAMPDGREVVAWVSAADSSTAASLYISIDGATPVELRDSLGPVEVHAEAPPKVAVGSDGSLHVIYVVGKEVPGRRFPLSALRYVHSLDGGKSWSSARTVTDDGDFGSHNFHSLTTGDSGRVIVSWLDGRHGPSMSSAYMTMSTDNGTSWSTNVRVDTTAACPCCRTAVSVGRDGALFLAWRSILPNDIRDIVITRLTAGDSTFGAPVRVHDDNWQFNGCPHAGPSLKVDRQGRVHIVWWTGKDGAAGVWYAHSDETGLAFGPAMALDVADFSRPAHPQLAIAGDTVVAVWDDGTQQVPRVKLKRSIDGGRTFSAAQLLSDTTEAASFPVVSLTAKGVSVAWTQLSTTSHAAMAHSEPDMKDPNSVKKLAAVGDARVIMRREVRH